MRQALVMGQGLALEELALAMETPALVALREQMVHLVQAQVTHPLLVASSLLLTLTPALPPLLLLAPLVLKPGLLPEPLVPKPGLTATLPALHQILKLDRAGPPPDPEARPPPHL